MPTRNVPGRCDRSLAQSAWESATPKKIPPVGYGVILAGVFHDGVDLCPDRCGRERTSRRVIVGLLECREHCRSPEEDHLSTEIYPQLPTKRPVRSVKDHHIEGRFA